MSTTKKKETTKTKYVGTYDLDKYIPIGNQFKREPDAIDRVLNDQAKMLAQKARHMQVKTYMKQMELDQKKMDQELGNTMNPSSNPQSGELAKLLLTNPNVQDQWLAMNPEARAILMTSATTLTQQGQSASSLAGLMPFMLMQMKQNPQTSVTEMVQLINVLRPVGNPGKSEAAELIKAITPLIQQQQKGKGGVSEVISALSPFLSQMAQKDQALFLERLRNMESRIVDPIDVLKSIAGNAELLGFTKGTPNIEVERLRAENQERMMRLNFEHQRWRDDKDLEIVAEKGRMDMMSNMINKGLDTAAPLLEKFVGGIENKKVNPPGVKAGFTLKCVECGTPIPIVGNPDSVSCPNCKLIHKKNLLDRPAPSPPKVQKGHGTFTMVKKP